MVLPCTALSLFPSESIEQVFARLLRGLRLLARDAPPPPVSNGAIRQARCRLGPRPLVALLHAVAKPRATATTPGAFLGGLRLVAQ